MIQESLRRLALFAELPEQDLEWLSAQAEPMTLSAGQILIEEGAPGDAAYIILDGEFEVVKKSDRQDITIAVRAEGEVMGEMALIDQSPRNATVRAVRGGHVLRIGEETFKQLLAHSPAASLSILRTVSRRLRQNEGLLRQSEKMAALGTLAAGLAHELNNPAAAVTRSAEQLRAALSDWSAHASALQGISFTPEQTQALETLKGRMQEPRPAAPLDSLAQSDRESELESWLGQHGVSDAWQLAPVLVGAGWDAAATDRLAQSFDKAQVMPVLKWLAAGLSVYSLLGEIRMGSERVSEIVKAVKAYSYLDQAPIQEVDLHEGLENTLVILRHKLKGIEVVREYAAGVPHIEAHGSELNQVWTNIIDNAAYAMGGSGRLRLHTALEGERVLVEIQDSGPGIPAEIQQRIFEPFYTTKPPGVGTGLGLHIAYNIINNHYGTIQLTSQPGNTCFRITLPVRLPR